MLKSKIWEVGEERPFVDNSKASLLRVMRALVYTKSKLLSSFSIESGKLLDKY